MQMHTMLSTCWGILLATSLAAQNQLPLYPFVQAHLKENAPEFLAKLNRFSYPDNAGGIQDRGGALQLDSTVLFTNYSASDSVPTTKTVFTYPSSHQNVQIEYTNTGTWEPVTRTAETTDALNRTVFVLSETNNAGVWEPESKLEVFPHGNTLTKLDSFTVFTWNPDSSTWQVALRVVTSFDDQDREVVIFTQFNDFFGQSLVLMDELSYDANGDNDVTIQSIFDSGAWTPFTRIESEYEQHRQILSTTYLIVDDQNNLPQNQTVTEYTATGKTGIIREFAWSFDTFDWELQQTTGYLYDNSDRQTSEVIDLPAGDQPERTWKQSDYVDGDNLFFEANFSWDFATGNWILNDKTYYYYSNTTSAPDVVNAGPLSLSPNPTNGLVRIPVQDNAKIMVLNAQGIAVQPTELSLTEGRIDLGNLPVGVYYIAVQQGNRRQVGTVVKGE